MRQGLSSTAITDGLMTRFTERRVIYSRRLTSTMEAARREVRKGAGEGTVIVTGEQTAGRGRIRRAWLSPTGSISLSIILYPAITHLPFLIMIASLAVVQCIRKVTGSKPGIKWPNDVLINGRKVCGILIESEVRGKRVDHAVIGIGINANLNPGDFPEIMQTATSLSHELGRDVSRLDIIRCLLVELERLYLTVRAGGSIYEDWRDTMVTLGRMVHVTCGDMVYDGIAESVTRDGSLLLRQKDGGLIKIVAGDVTLRDSQASPEPTD